ncbi:MAG: macro domain-containing protein [Deltaproteobacteria bacterium]|nr:macro domain-containing protein [Deltaproteobacteria bacterium]
MGKITYVIGDATAPQTPGPKMIIHICNDIGAWGKGFVLAVSRRWPQIKRYYREWYQTKSDFRLGAIQSIQVNSDIWVVNMIGQKGIRHTKAGPPIRYQALEQCLSKIAEGAKELGASIHMPRIGSGLAGGDWVKIEPIISRQLCNKGLAVYVYDIRI